MFSLLTGCNLVEPMTTAPYYIRIDSIPFRDSLVQYLGRNQGRNAVSITDAWVFVNGRFAGCYELPATIPVEAGDPNVNLNVMPGVLSDGIRDYRVSYQFYKGWYGNVLLERGKVKPFKFGTSYFATNRNLKVPFPLFNDFENVVDTSAFQLSSNNACGAFSRTTKPEEVYPDGGRTSMVIYNRNKTDGIMEVQTANNFTLPQDGSPVYLELNYKCNTTFLVGLYYVGGGSSGYIYDLNLTKTDGQWRKVYVSLSDELISSPRQSAFKIAVRARGTSGGQEQILLDNIRLLQMDR